MSKFFYKKNKKYGTGGKVKYDNGGNVTGPDTPFKINPMAIDLAKNNPHGYEPGTRAFNRYQNYLDQPTATRNVSADLFNPNLDASFTQGIGGSNRGQFNYSPSLIRTGPDTNIGNEGSKGSYSIGPSFTHSGGFTKDFETGFNRSTLGLNYAYQQPLNRSGSLVGGFEGEMGSLLKGSDTKYGTNIGDITTQHPTRGDGGYGMVSAGLGYYPTTGVSRGISANIGYGSQYSPNAGFTYGIKGHAGPVYGTIDKTAAGFGIGFGAGFPITTRTRKRINDAYRQDFDKGGNVPELDKEILSKRAKMEKDAGYKAYQRQLKEQSKKLANGGIMGQDPSQIYGPEGESIETGGPGSMTFGQANAPDLVIPTMTNPYGIDGNIESGTNINVQSGNPMEDLDILAGRPEGADNILSKRELFDKTKVGQYIGKFQEGANLAGEVTQGVGAVRTGAGLIGQMFDAPDAGGQKNPLISAGRGVLSGAQAGANIGKYLGPKGAAVGTVVGAGLGAISGVVDSVQNRMAANRLEQEERLAFNQNAARSTNEALLSYLKRENQPVVSQPEEVPEDPTKTTAAFGAKIMPDAKSTTLTMGDINPHVSDESWKRYAEQLKMGENAGNKGYDKEKDLWYPFDVGIKGEKNIGWGINMSTFNKEDREKMSKGITTKELETLYSGRIAKHLDKSKDKITKMGGNWDNLPDNVKLALTDFSYNLGSLNKFPKFTQAIIDNDLATAMKEYKRYYKDADGKKHELTLRNKDIYNMLFKSPKSKTEIYKAGGMTKGEYDHKTNPLIVVDKNGNDTGMELTGGEGVYDAEAQNEIEKALKKKNYKRVGKIIEYEINDWKKRGTYS